MKNKRSAIVITFIILYAVYLYISIRGQYLQTMEIGQEYVPIFMQNIKYKTIVITANFLFVFILTYITTVFIKKGLKKFFIEEKKDMPKLPNKSISLIFATIISMVTSDLLIKKIILAFNSAWFGIEDPIFGFDLGYYIFQKPFINLTLYYLIGMAAFMAIYITIYYVLCFNIYFKEGINVETLKKNTFLKQILFCIVVIILLIAAIKIVNIQDIVYDNFIQIKNGESLTRSRYY